MKALIAVLFCALPIAASAQDAAAAGQGSGPMVVQRVHNTVVIAPDFKISRLDGHDARIAGAYGGWLVDEQWLIGGGGYWLTNGASGRRLGYGGAVLGWVGGTDHPITFSARTLIGWGEARLTDTVPFITIPFDFNDRMMNDFRALGLNPSRFDPMLVTRDLQVRFSQQFFVAEPQVDAVFRVASWGRLNAGVGYRAIGAADRNERRLRGATASVSLQVGNF